ncbi:MAG TPA: GLPGLI family protein [Leeuwenhoekiella sp.]|nr:GLPGLI family protein [Leeuwenhoekiella sp.]
MQVITRIITLGLSLLYVFATQAQQINSGIATYQTKTTLDMDNWNRGGQMSEQQKKQIAERMKNRLEKTFTLSFNKDASTYAEVEKLETPGNGGGGGRWGNFSQGAIYKDISADQYVRENDLMGKLFLVQDSLPKLEWKLEKESKMIGQYAAFKATATRKIEDNPWEGMRNIRQREQDSSAAENRPIEETIVAWYTPQIPVSQGPGEYYGLPGLILEVNAGRTVILCNKIVLNPEESVDIKKPSKGKEVSRKEYEAVVAEKTKEMAERFQGGRGGFGGRRN